MKIIDSHAHIFPDSVAAKASSGIGNFYDMDVRFDGRLCTLLDQGSAAGISHYVVQSVATVPEQVCSINDFIAFTSAENTFITGLGTLHPYMDNPAAEVERIIELGLRGVKLHPDFQQFNLDDERVFPIYEALVNRLPLLTHSGDFRHDFSHPRRLYNVINRFPDLTVIAAHFGGWSVWNEAETILNGIDIYIDTSSSFYTLDDEQILRLIKTFGENRVLFGTDYPMWEAAAEVRRLQKLNLSDAVKEKIFFKNAEKLWGIVLEKKY